MTTTSLGGRNVLVVEDEYLMAMSLSDELQEAGAKVVGPAASVAKAMRLVDAADAIDFALLDLNLGGESAFPLADVLAARGVPFVFLTGYDASAIPAAYRAVPRLGKPLAADEIVRSVAAALAGGVPPSDRAG